MVNSTAQINKLVQKYVFNLQKKGIRPIKIVLYGSYAKGNPNKWSDLDLIVVSPDFKKYSQLKRLILLSKATANLSESIEAFGYTPEEIPDEEDKTPALWDIARKTGKIVYSE
ncbi:MAG: hypothetical protein ACD_58C00082G0001 [uncultured bacterium]|nr:MAG: hypothetical protein ACD_58C00082G0001 [uncultured bacterium]